MYKTRSKNIQRRIESGNGWNSRKNYDSLNTNKEKAKQIRVGSLYTGTVIKIIDSGAVVNIKGISGFLHISEISSEWVDHPSEFLSLHQYVNVWVISNKIDSKGRISIKVSMKEPPRKSGLASVRKKYKKIKKQKSQIKKETEIKFTLKCESCGHTKNLTDDDVKIISLKLPIPYSAINKNTILEHLSKFRCSKCHQKGCCITT